MNETSPKYEFTCAYCGIRHPRDQELVSEQIICKCGYSFYVYACNGVIQQYPWNMFCTDHVCRVFQQMMYAIGHFEGGTDLYELLLSQADPEALLTVALDRFQDEILEMRKKMVCGDLVSALKSIRKDRDVMIRTKKDGVQICEINSKTKEPLFMPESAMDQLLRESRRWRTKDMDTEAADTGCRLGDAG